MKPSSSKLWILLLCCLGWIPSQAENLPPLPAQKLPPNLPKFAAWEITLKYESETGAGAGDPTQNLSPGEETEPSRNAVARPKKITVTRTDNLIQEETLWTNNQTSKKWVYERGMQIMEEPSTGRLLRLPPAPMFSDYTDYSQGDFSDLVWIGPQNYKGVHNVEGRPSFFFSSVPGTVFQPGEEQLNAELPEELRGSKGNTRELTAAIDVETLLPVFFSDGYVTKTYRILPPPTSALKMPPEFAAEFEKWITRIREARRVPGPP
jgi:hypothetical protein